jgi:hypothetical protein
MNWQSPGWGRLLARFPVVALPDAGLTSGAARREIDQPG